MRLNQPELAESRLNSALALDPDYPRPHEILGELFMGQDEAEEAVEAFRRATELDPTRAATHMKLGLALLKLGLGLVLPDCWDLGSPFSSARVHQAGPAKGHCPSALPVFTNV